MTEKRPPKPMVKCRSCPKEYKRDDPHIHRDGLEQQDYLRCTCGEITLLDEKR